MATSWVSLLYNALSWLVLLGSLGLLIAYAIFYTQQKHVRPGEHYKVGNQTYQVPKIPARTHRGSESLNAQIPIMDEKVMLEQRRLLTQVTEMFDELNVQYWISDETLLGIHGPHETTLPWEPTLYLTAPFREKHKLFKFASLASERKLQFDGQEFKSEEDGVTYQFSGQTTLRVGFVHDAEPGVWRKVARWNREPVYHPQLAWSETDLFPLQQLVTENFRVFLPANPHAVLATQYGNRFPERQVYREPEFQEWIVRNLPTMSSTTTRASHQRNPSAPAA